MCLSVCPDLDKVVCVSVCLRTTNTGLVTGDMGESYDERHIPHAHTYITHLNIT